METWGKRLGYCKGPGVRVAGAELGERWKGDHGQQGLHPHLPVTPRPFHLPGGPL